jgi:hypothetical protein
MVYTVLGTVKEENIQINNYSTVYTDLFMYIHNLTRWIKFKESK